MTEAIAANIWLGAGVYAGLGLLVAVALMFGGMKRIDALAATAPWSVKLLVTPGIVALWPLMLTRLIAGKQP
jgi:hypothetical protein